jgi:hypothetical protein
MMLFGAHTSVSSRKIGNLRNITGRIAYNPQGKTRIALIPACSARARWRWRMDRNRQYGCYSAILCMGPALQAACNRQITADRPHQDRHETKKIAGENDASI